MSEEELDFTEFENPEDENKFENKKNNTTEEKETEEMTLQLGDIIEIKAPSNHLLHENTFFIDYINDRRVVLIDVASLEQTQLNKDQETGIFTDESIEQIILVSRSETLGYARQNNLIPGTWIEIYINGDVSTIITGEITSLEEDQIEIKTIPELDVIYIDFEYKGLPDNIPIKKIVIRDKPAGYDLGEDKGNNEGDIEPTIEPHMEYLETGEAIIYTEEDAEEQENILELLRQEVAKTKGVTFGEDLEEVEQMIELPENRRRYGIDLQTSSLLDELLSTIPATKRNTSVMRKVHTLIARYRELRNQYSLFDENGEVRNFRRNNPQLHKPIIQVIQEQAIKIDWVLPVVSIKKKIYSNPGEDIDINDTDTTPIVIDDVLGEQQNIVKNMYFNDRAITDESKYYKLYQQLADLMEPFENPLELPNYLNKANVKTNLESIVDNYGEFDSSVISKNDLVKQRYVIQKYDLGLNRRKLQRHGDRDIVETTPMTSPDTMYIKSMVVLPAPVVHWSRVHMPETSILEKANLHQFSLVLFRMLNKNKDIAPFIIDDFEKDFYENDDTEFLASMRHYTLSDNLLRTEKDNRFEKFLQAMIPKTKTLIHIVRKYIVQKLSFVAVVQSLESFHIYPKDISYKQYMEIRRFLIEQINNKKTYIEDGRKDFSFLTGYKQDPRILSFVRIFTERPELLDTLLDGYQLPSRELLEKYYTTYEIIQKCISIDQGVLLSLLLQSLMVSLQIPASLTTLFDIDPMNQEEKIKAADCHKRVLSKKYTSTADLQKDNGKDIYFDKELDETQYNLLDNYKDERKRMLPDVFERFLVENLIQKHKVEEPETIARILIRGKKLVKDGDFAVVVIIPDIEDIPESVEQRRKLQDAAALHKKSVYYYRKNDVWIHHKEMDDEAFMDTQDLFCNVKKECVMEVAQCSSVDEVASRMRVIAQQKMKDEFSNRFDLADEDSKATLKNRLDYQIRFIQKLIRIQAVQREKTNNIQYQIGVESSKMTDVIVSPHIELLNKILGQTDFVKKQNDIVRLYDFCCREPMELLTEDVGWKYCRLSNTKFLPAFLYDLAKTFVTGGDYTLALEEKCHTHGLLSDSGNAIVDKYSGRVIRAIDFAEEDGYDEAGFKVSTHAFIQKGGLDKTVENLIDVYSTTDKQVCEGEQAQLICQLLEGISKQIGYDIKNKKDRPLRLASLMCDKLIDTEEKYAKDAKKAEEKKGIKLAPYKKRSQQLTLLITATILFMTIQMEIPSFQSLKSMPGCVKSFRGFPLSGEEDMSGLHYMACVLSKMEKKTEPWNTLERLTIIMLQEQMKKIIIASLKEGEIDDLYLKKREYTIMNEIDEIPVEQSVQKWQHFLPPLTQISVNSTTVSADFKDHLFSAMRKGSKHQHTDVFALDSKIAKFGFSIISAIQKIVKSKEMLLVSHSTGTPFLQNVCCNEKERVPILYFAEEDPDIQRYIKSAKVLETISNSVSVVSKAAFLFDPRGRPWEYPVVSQEITETIIYAAFIHYCQLDKGKGVPKVFHSFFTDVPVGYPEKGSLEEKIAFLKRQDKRFSLAQFNELLQIIHRSQIVEVDKPVPYHRSNILKDLMDLFDKHESPVIDSELRDDIRSVLEKYDKTKLVSVSHEDEEDRPEPENLKMSALKDLKNNLAETIQDQFKPKILAFFKKNGKLSPKEFERLTGFFNTFVSQWATNDIYQVANFVKNTIYEWTSVFPKGLMTNVSNKTGIHEYWGLAKIDKIRLYSSIKEYYNPLGEFRDDPVIRRLLLDVQPKFIDLRLFFNHLPIQEAIRVGSRDYYSFFDKDTVYLLLEYIILSVLHEYIIATDDRNLLQLDQVEKKREKREQIKESSQPVIQTEFNDLPEEYEDVYNDMTELQINAGDREELKKRVAKMLLAFINITRKNKSDMDVSYENIATMIRKRKDKEKNRITERFKNMSEDEKNLEQLKKKFKMDEWNVGTQKGIFIYDIGTSTREVMEQKVEEELDIKKHGIRQADFIEIHGDMGEQQPLREMIDVDEITDEMPDEDTGILGLKGGFMDGQFYSDDESDDDFGDDS